MRTNTTRRGLTMTELGLGTAQLGNLFKETTDEQATSAVETAWDNGIRYFDTSPHYGMGLSERRLGAVLATKPRDEFVLSTKVGRLIVPSPETAGQMAPGEYLVPADTKREWDFSRDGILRSVEASLGRLGLDRIDILYLHDPDDHWESASTTGIDTLIELREQGVVGAVGAGMNQTEMLARLIRHADIDLVMVAGRFTLLEQGALDDLLPLALDHKVGVVAVGIYNSGLMSRPRPAADANYNYEQAPTEIIERANAIADVCEAHGVTLPVAALAYPLSHPAVVSVVVGSRDGSQVEGTIERYSSPVPDALWSDLRSAGLLSA